MALSGLNKFKQKQEERKGGGSPFFKPGPGEHVRIRPLVELGEDSPNFDPDKGTANFVVEYVNPVKFWLSVVDEQDGTPNVGREMVKEFGWYKAQNPDLEKNQHNDKTKNWNPKNRWYLPVLVDRRDGSDITVEVLQLAFGDRAPFAPMIDFYESKNTVTDRWWDYSRNEAKEMNQVSYKVVPDDPSPMPEGEWEIPNIDDAPYVNHVPYESQREFLQIDDTYRAKHTEQVKAPGPKAAVTDADAEPDW